MSLKLGTTDIAGIPTGLIDTVNSKADVNTTANATIFNTQGKSLISGLGFPSNRYIDLTLGASGSTYTAPANGYFLLYGQYSSGANSYFDMYVLTSNIGYRHYFATNVAEGSGRGFVPVKKSQQIQVIINGSLEFYDFKFIYAEGEPSS